MVIWCGGWSNIRICPDSLMNQNHSEHEEPIIQIPTAMMSSGEIQVSCLESQGCVVVAI